MSPVRRAPRSTFFLVVVLAPILLLVAASCGRSDPPADATPASTTEPFVTPPPAPDTTAATTPPTQATLTPSAPTTAPPLGVGNLTALAGRTIAVDPGHNGGNGAHAADISKLVDIGNRKKECDTTGTQTDSGYTESAYNLDVAMRLTSLLQANGAKVVLTRSDNSGWGPCIDERAAIGNRAGADVAISIHADGGPSSGRGFHVNYPASIPGLTDAIAASSRQLAIDVRDAFASGTGTPYSTYLGSSALLPREDLGGLNLSKVPKVLLETGNMRNASDVALLTDPTFRQRQAAAIALGLATYLADH